jgi:hypothetical protein
MNKKKSHTKKQSSTNSEDEVVEVLKEGSEVTAASPPRKRKKKKTTVGEEDHYVNGREFEEAIRQYYDSDVITNYLGDSIRKIAVGLSYATNFINYSFKEDMIGDAVLKMYQALKHKKFKLNQGFSPFSYFTTIAFHAFISRIKREKKHHQVVEDFKERQYNLLINSDEDMKNHRVYTRPGNSSDDNYNTPQEFYA